MGYCEFVGFLERFPVDRYAWARDVKSIEFDLVSPFKELVLDVPYHFYWRRWFIPHRLDTGRSRRLKELVRDWEGKPWYTVRYHRHFRRFLRERVCHTPLMWITGHQKFICSTGKLKIVDVVDERLESHLAWRVPDEIPDFEDVWRRMLDVIDVDEFIEFHKRAFPIGELGEVREKHPEIWQKVGSSWQADVLSGLKLYALLGLKARFYRILTAILTQFTLLAALEELVKCDRCLLVHADPLMDARNIDGVLLDVCSGRVAPLQVKKRSGRKLARRTTVKGDILVVEYSLKGDDGLTERLPSGFRVFTLDAAKDVLAELKRRM